MRHPESVIRAIDLKRQQSLARQLLHYINLLIEIVRRCFSSSRVSHPLYSTLSHPLFQQRNGSSLFESSLRSKSLVRYSIGVPFVPHQADYARKPLVVEVVDHPLHSVPSVTGICHPYQYLQFCQQIERIYLSSNITDLVVYSQKIISLFSFYLPGFSFVNFHVLPPPWRCNFESNRIQGISGNLNFLAISSSFQHKATILLLDAWEQFLDMLPNQAIKPQLTLVCHDIPSKIIESLPSSVLVIDEIPLNASIKSALFRSSHVYISCSVMDGIGPLEALSYAKPIISLNTINASTYVTSSNGFLVELPFDYYDPIHYGTTWKLDSDFLSLVTSQPSRSFVASKLSHAMLRYAVNPCLIDDHSESSRHHYLSSFTLEHFSTKLSSILATCISD